MTLLDAFEPEPASFFVIHPVKRSQSRKVELFIEELTREPSMITAGEAKG